MPTAMQREFPVILPLVLQLIGLLFVVLSDTYMRREHRQVMLCIIAVVFSLVVQNNLEAWLTTSGVSPFARKLVGIYGYCTRPVIIVFFFYIVDMDRSHWLGWLLVGLNAAIYLTALFTDISFTITESNAFRRGPLGYSCHFISSLLLAYLLFITSREFNRVRKAEALIPIFNVLLIIVSIVLDTEVYYSKYSPIAFLTITMVSSTVFYYIWLHLQFVREHEDALRAEQRIQIMMSQIQPHFLYNTLSTIQALCRIDPEKAFDTVGMFGKYLRQNIDSLDQPELIPVRKELEHTQLYAEIEMIRFPNIRVEYDVEDEGFSLPALTIQPMVENAIRHGVRIRQDGLVSVLTRRTLQYHEVVISDNGIGFDPADVSPEETHIGIRNVRERLERMCGGTLDIESVPGRGTTVTIRSPIDGPPEKRRRFRA